MKPTQPTRNIKEVKIDAEGKKVAHIEIIPVTPPTPDTVTDVIDLETAQDRLAAVRKQRAMIAEDDARLQGREDFLVQVIASLQ